jgi:hypothetical protein
MKKKYLKRISERDGLQTRLAGVRSNMPREREGERKRVKRWFVTNVKGTFIRMSDRESRHAILGESQPALKFRVNRPRPRSQPARAAGRVCWLFIFFHGS